MLDSIDLPVECPNGPASLVIRHEGLFPEEGSPIRLDVLQSVYRGNSHLVHLSMGEQVLVLQWPDAIEAGQKVPVGIDRSKVFCYPR